MIKIPLKIIKYIWCLPQNLIGLMVSIFTIKKHVYTVNGVKVYNVRWNSSASIGNKIFIGVSHWGKMSVLKHEFGHYKQGLILGWLWIPVIGIPSLIWAGFLHTLLNRIRLKKGKDYIEYSWFYTEKWANKLVGVEFISEI